MHSNRCLRDSCRIMGTYLVSSDRFVVDAIYYLTQKGKLEIELSRDENNEADGDWVIHFYGLDGSRICGGDNDLVSALCSIVQHFGEEN